MQEKISIPFADFVCSKFHKEMTDERPQLIEVAERMQSFWDNGKTGDVMNISMPTRFGKSFISTAFSVWLLLGDPSLRILRASYAADLAETFSVQVREQYIRMRELLKMTNFTIVGTRSRWSINGRVQPSHAGVGIGGGITGFGFDVAIVDDTAKSMLEATSAAYSKTLTSFRESVLLGRLEGRRKILNVGTRWTVNDWFSYWSDAEEFILPAMVDGHSVCEAWKTTAELELERSRVSDEVWNAQYMQRPTATGRIRLFEGWRPKTAEAGNGKRYVVIDPATDYGSDYFVCGLYEVESGIVTLCDMFAEQRATITEVAEWLKGQQYAVAFCESNGAGANIINKLRHEGVRSVAGFSTNKDKYSRAYTQLDDMKNYFRIAPTCNQRAVEELLREADAFPVESDGIHDDLIDNVVMAFEHILNR